MTAILLIIGILKRLQHETAQKYTQWEVVMTKK